MLLGSHRNPGGLTSHRVLERLVEESGRQRQPGELPGIVVEIDAILTPRLPAVDPSEGTPMDRMEGMRAERLVRSIKHECLNRVIPFGEHHLRGTIAEFIAHDHGELSVGARVRKRAIG